MGSNDYANVQHIIRSYDDLAPLARNLRGAATALLMFSIMWMGAAADDNPFAKIKGLISDLIAWLER